MLLLALPAFAHIPFHRGELTITEIHTGPAEEGGQWFEVRNNTDNTQNLIEQFYTDADGNTFEVTLGVLVTAGGHAVFASRDSTVDADFHFDSTFDLRADAGSVTQTDLYGVVDEVVWDATWGVSGDWQADLGVEANEWANGLPGNWCAGGSAGADNARCPGTDADDDGDGYTEVDGDCDDSDAAVHPGAADHGDGLGDDADCDLTRDEDGGADTGTPVDTGDTGETADTADTQGETGETGETDDTGATPDTDTGTAGDDTGEPEEPGKGAYGGGCGRSAGFWLLATPVLWRRRSRRSP